VNHRNKINIQYGISAYQVQTIKKRQEKSQK